ncbi:MAG TPA: oxygenase MpaB family protein, partial [Caulobacteraceae bacterium]|nr:oxygenase MpaB family protein [Caulobacteraceae bacterium]
MSLAETTAEPPPIPARHGRGLTHARRIGRLLRMVAGGAGADPTPQEWETLGRALTRGDPDMDRLLDWKRTVGLREGRAMFERALEHGLDADAPGPLGDFFAIYGAQPDWVDEALLARGAEVCQMTGAVGAWVMRDGALMGGYQSPDFNRVLVMTGALEKGSSKRLAETSHWWLACTEQGGMARFGEGLKSTLRVRLIHAMVRRHVAERDDWDVVEDGVPINQLDMAATQLAFSIVLLQGVRTLGYAVSAEDGRAVIHLMRYVGWLMGVELALQPTNEREGMRLLYGTLLSVVAPSDTSGRTLAQALADEPLNRPYKVLPWLRRRWEREKNLSINLFFIGRAGMDNLGLPKRYIPWFPLATMPVNAVRFAWGNRSPQARRRMAARGRRWQHAHMVSL